MGSLLELLVFTDLGTVSKADLLVFMVLEGPNHSKVTQEPGHLRMGEGKSKRKIQGLKSKRKIQGLSLPSKQPEKSEPPPRVMFCFLLTHAALQTYQWHEARISSSQRNAKGTMKVMKELWPCCRAFCITAEAKS